VTRRALVTALLAACTPGPAYHVPAAPLPARDAFKEGTWKLATPADAIRRGAWWSMFHEPELDALEAKLQIDNQTIRQAIDNYLAACAQIRVVRAQLFPTVSTAPSVTVSRAPRVAGHTTNYTLPLDASWAPDLFGRVRGTVHQAQFTAQASAADVESARLLAQSTLAATYFELRGQDALADVLGAAVAADQQILELTRAQYEVGVGNEAAVVLADQTLQIARVQATNVTLVRAQFEHAIATLIGVPASAFSLPHRALRAAPPAIPASTPSQLLERRPDIAAAERAMAAANAAIGVGYAAYFPTLTLTGDVGFASTALSTLLSWPNRVWSVGATLGETILEAGSRLAVVDQARATYAASVASYRQAVLTGVAQVEDGLAAARVLAQELIEQRRAVELAQRGVELERGRYETGIDPYLNLMTEQVTLLTQQQALVSIEIQQMTSAVALIQALGGGWSRAELPTTSVVTRQRP
jgi:NodT family efflux transporter outer membrane factor (OMF) lipoprotein